ncbi:MAG: M1 family metallopeptidase [Chloroflexota bacterium]|nr:M1 family metallopeptidase [Chloroflexota bacterium]
MTSIPTIAFKPHLLSVLRLALLMFASSAAVFAQQPGADGLGDRLYPRLGNGGYDVGHYAIDLAFTPENNHIVATAIVEALALQDLSSFNLDLSGLVVDNVFVNDEPARFDRDDSELVISPSQALTNGEAFTARIAYGGVPAPISDPAVPWLKLGWQRWTEGYVAAVSEPSGSMNWFPSNNHPLDKATFVFRLTVPQPYTAVANGVLSETINNADDTRTFVWHMRQPMASYLALAAVGEFVEFRDESGPIIIRNYFPPDTDPGTITAYDVTGEMMSWLINLLGPYPFDEYGVVVVPGFPMALETQSMSIFGETMHDPEIILHELVHQWFGNSVTLMNWTDTWLHEGFASYFDALWVGEHYGVRAYDGYVTAALNSNTALPAPGNPEKHELFSLSVYFRGALVLHALREEVGDETFFEILRTFYSANAYGNVDTADFIAHAERLSQRELDELFDAWLYGERIPDLP